MRRYLLAAVAAAAIATPALARDGSPYVGIEAGVVIPQDPDFDVTVRDGATSTRYTQALRINLKRSLEGDVLAGYDFGLFRLEGELGYKKLRAGEARLFVPTLVNNRLLLVNNQFNVPDNGSILSLMANALIDVGDENGWSAYVGLGAGRARVKLAGDRDSALAGQAIAGVRYAITPNIDLGLKYRYFRTSKLNFNDSLTNANGVFGLTSHGKVRTNSILATLTYNFYSPPPPPIVVVPIAPPPPPPPATQTCYDGSVILATDVCPQPPVETPPPPPPVPERG